MKPNTQPSTTEEEVGNDFPEEAATEDVLKISEQLIQQNKKLYKELAKTQT